MKQIARLMSIAVLIATLSLPALARERVDEAPTFYSYNIDECKAIASGIGEVTATFLYYWDIAAQENRVSYIVHVSYDLEERYIGSAYLERNAVTVEIRAPVGVLIKAETCEV